MKIIMKRKNSEKRSLTVNINFDRLFLYDTTNCHLASVGTTLIFENGRE